MGDAPECSWVTRQWIELLSRERSSYQVQAGYAETLLHSGSRADAAALCSLLIDSDLSYRLDVVLGPIMAHGDPSLARRLLDAARRVDWQARDDLAVSVLHALGYLGCQDAVELLVEQAVVGNHYQCLHACLGLLHLDLSAHADTLLGALERCAGKNLFPEFLPALAAKLDPDPARLQWLLAQGQSASTDCNGGLLLGIALFGAQARGVFLDVLDDPLWEAQGGGTGTDRWAFVGTRLLEIELGELYQRVHARWLAGDHGAQQRHRVQVLLALVQLRLRSRWTGLRQIQWPGESLPELAELLFGWRTPNQADNLSSIVSAVLPERSSSVHELERLLPSRIVVELMSSTTR